jgi:hypothetical protein
VHALKPLKAGDVPLLSVTSWWHALAFRGSVRQKELTPAGGIGFARGIQLPLRVCLTFSVVILRISCCARVGRRERVS